MTSKTSIDLSFGRREFVILGTEYAGEMKKGVFTIMNYLMPKQGVLSMHCSATQARDGSDTSVLFGLSGTGKTTLSADPKRLLIGDDEHCWSDDGVFNIEGGCYAKVIKLSQEQEPDIWNALAVRRGARERHVRPVHAQRRLRRHVDHREHARQLHPRHDPEREAPCGRRSPEERHLPHGRRVRRAAAGVAS